MKTAILSSFIGSATALSLRGGDNHPSPASDLTQLAQKARSLNEQMEVNVHRENESRKLIYDVDKSKICFQDDVRTNGVDSPHDADYYQNPFFANNDRGDWGKCIPEEVFGVLCEHNHAHKLNDGSWTIHHGPLHDQLSEMMFLKLQGIHDDYCVHVDVELTDALQQKFNDFYFARNEYAIGQYGDDIGSDARMIIRAAGGKQYVNGVSHPTLVLYRGVTYTFDVSHVSNDFHPFKLGTADGVEYTSGVTYGDNEVVFHVPDDAPDHLVYYCDLHQGMGNAISIIDVNSLSEGHEDHGMEMRRKLDGSMQDHPMVTYQDACRTLYPGSPRIALQMSVYCLVGFVDQALPHNTFESPYELSNSCDAIVKSHLENRYTEELSKEPREYCTQNIEEDTCTVSVRVDKGETCEEFCRGHKGLTCTSAALSSWQDECADIRPWSCNEPQELSWKLMCTCGPDDEYVPPPEDSTITPACATMMIPSDLKVNRYCDQDFEEDTCTAVIDTRTAPMRSCSSFCEEMNMECARASEEYYDSCIIDYHLDCDEVISSSDMLCTCKSTPQSLIPPFTVSQDCKDHCESHGMACISSNEKTVDECVLSNGLPCTKAEDIAYQLEFVCAPPGEGETLQDAIASESCANMFMYPSGPKPKTFCPPTVLSNLPDTCTSVIDMWRVSSDHAHHTCNDYCESYPGMKCVAAGRDKDDSCHHIEEVACSYQDYGDLICACAIDETALAAEETARDEPVSNACMNMMLHPNPVSAPEQICSSNSAGTCTVVAQISEVEVRSCDEYCRTFPGMECRGAQKSKWGSCRTDGASTCSTVTTENSMICECGFIEGSPYESHLLTGPSFEQNSLVSCPAYEYSTTPNNDGNLYHLNEEDRSYTKLTLTLDYDSDKADGSVKVAGTALAADLQDRNSDSYSTPHVELCDGYESHIREGDPPEKCSFGHRTSSDSNCYGKVHGLDYDEAAKACSDRGGHIVMINSASEFNDLTSTFKDQSFMIGLRDYSGNEWRWDGDSTGEVVDPHSLEYADFSESEFYDCVLVRVRSNGEIIWDSKACTEKQTYMCEGIKEEGAAQGGDLLADEGGFCLWYVPDRDLYLPDDEQNGFQNTELAHFLQYHEELKSRYYVNLYDSLYFTNVEGHAENEANWDDLTMKKVGIDSDELLLDKSASDDYFHCHFSPTNFGISRIYFQQHMLERLYPGSFEKHCFCGYKHIGNLVGRCDCTRSGDQNGRCQTEHEKMLWEETYHETGQYVFCNNGNCNGQSP